MRILIIPPGDLPIPAFMGGAIETLTTYLLDINENANKPIEFVVFNHEMIGEELIKYNRTRLLSCHSGFIKRKIYTLLYKAVRLFSLRKVYLPNYYIHCVNKHLKKCEYDIILVEGEYLQGLNIKHHSKLLLHLHTDLLYKGALREKDVVAKYDGFICVSEFIKKRVCSIKGMDESKCYVLKNCVDERRFSLDNPNKKINRDALEFNEGDYVITYCGRLSKEKGFKELVEAFSKINDVHSKLMVIGSKWFGDNSEDAYIKEVKNIIKTTMVEDKVKFIGYIAHSDLPQYMAVSDVVVVPSICNEAASLCVIEAQALGIPVIATDVGGIPEYINRDISSLIKLDEFFVESLKGKLIYYQSIVSNTKPENAQELKRTNTRNRMDYYSDFVKIINSR